MACGARALASWRAWPTRDTYDSVDDTLDRVRDGDDLEDEVEELREAVAAMNVLDDTKDFVDDRIDRVRDHDDYDVDLADDVHELRKVVVELRRSSTVWWPRSNRLGAAMARRRHCPQPGVGELPDRLVETQGGEAVLLEERP